MLKGFFQYFLIFSYLVFYALVIISLFLFDWSEVSILTTLVLFLVASFTADFFSGIWHLMEDFYPLNYEKGFDKIFYYKGSRSSDEFLALRKKAFSKATLLEKLAYKAKIHGTVQIRPFIFTLNLWKVLLQRDSVKKSVKQV